MFGKVLAILTLLSTVLLTFYIGVRWLNIVYNSAIAGYILPLCLVVLLCDVVYLGFPELMQKMHDFFAM